MQKRYVIAGIVIVVLGVVAWFALGDSSIEYADVARAEKLGKTVQVVGTWVKEEGSKYDEHGNLFTFYMNDEKGKRVFVELTGAKPNNFEIATSIVVRGRMDGSTFKATNVLTKCPSKYDGQPASTKVTS